MNNLTQRGYFILTDISGYTSFVAETELEHAHDILSDLLQTVCKSIQGLLTIHKLEGDAVFAYALEDRIQRGEILLELIESTYLGFRDRQLAIKQATTCTCKACSNIPSLDLKFICHTGEFIIQKVSGITEMVGTDVNLVHRLSKNHVTEQTGWKAYILFTAQCLEKLQLNNINTVASTETYEHLGEIHTYSLDLHQRYAELINARRVILKDSEADISFQVDFPTSAPIAWEWLLSPAKRNVWGGNVKWSTGERRNGRIASGASNHCAHGGGISTEVILDWRPFEYATSESYQGDKKRFTETVRIEGLPQGGSRVHDLIRLKVPLPRWLRRILARMIFVKTYKMDQLLLKVSELAAEDVVRSENVQE